ncbi:MAG: 3'-5' exonuclease [Candidatus Saccharibacteria bacterium]|nr:3'-5' exonuclease [Candidatus Saccharibacteria bacterium]
MSDYKNLMRSISGRSFLILDTETTGLHDGEIVQIAIINQQADVLLNTYVKPARPIPIDAQRIHGISDETVASAPTWPQLVDHVRSIIQGQLLIVYNAVYDRRMMHQSGEYHGLEKVEWKNVATWFCAMEAYAEHYGDWNAYRQSYRWQKLSNAAAQCGVNVANAHDALGDCLMTLGVVRAMEKSYWERVK